MGRTPIDIPLNCADFNIVKQSPTQNRAMVSHCMITVSKEDYLKAILEAEFEGPAVISATLAHWLSVSPPAVTMALRRLKKDGLVKVHPDGRVRLTPAGKSIARRTITRHYLIERMLHEVFGMEWYKVHDEAERLEHAVSDEFAAKLASKLGYDGDCPHGNGLLPESPEQRRRKGLRPLAEAEPGKGYAVDSVFERDRTLLVFLDRRGIKPGAHITVRGWNYDQTLALETPEGNCSVGHLVAERVWIASSPKSARRKSILSR